MRKLRALKTAVITLVVALVCWPSHWSRAEEETSTQTVRTDVVVETGDGKTMRSAQTESKDALVSTDNELGKFSRFPFHVSVTVRGGYDDNVFTSSIDPQGSAFTNASIALSYDFGSPRTKLTLATGGGVTYYFDRPGDSSPDFNAYLSLSVAHKATPRLTLSATVYASYQVEPDFAFNLGLNRRTGNYFYTTDKFTAAYLWTPRFATATSFTFGAVKYDDSAIAFFEDRLEYTFGNEFRFLLWPTTTLVAEYRFGIVDYDQIARNSTTHFLLAGFDHSFSRRLNLSVRAGEEFRSYDQTGDQNSPYFESALSYEISKRTSAVWTTRYSIEEPDVAAAQSRTTFRTGLQVKYGITPRLAATLGAYYQHDDYDATDTLAVVSPAFTEDSFDIALALRYAVTRNLAFEIGYNHTEITSDVVLREYSRSRYYGGVNFSF